jgi:hypothetical protein
MLRIMRFETLSSDFGWFTCMPLYSRSRSP